MQKDSTIEVGTLYDINKQIMAQLPPQPSKKLKKKLVSIGTWFGTVEKEKQWYMLLCREKADYTVFHFNSNNYMQAVEDLQLCINNRGKLMAIDYIHGENAYEIWIKDQETGEVFLYMLFNCYPMIIEI